MSHALAEDAASTLGADVVRGARDGDLIDGIPPKLVIEPSAEEGVAAALAWASGRSLSVVVRGGGTKSGRGTPLAGVDVVLSTRRLDHVIEHRHGDLTATIQAGATLASVNRQLGQHRQWLPLDPPWAERATIGGILAANDSGPRRHRYGAPRDLIIGVTMARTDGRLAKAGGIVVKNVAGYDLGRLLVGSFGSLGVIVSATFKLSPIPETSVTAVVDLALPRIGELVLALSTETVTPSAVEIEMPPGRLLIRFETIEAAIDSQVAVVRRLVERCGGRLAVVGGSDEATTWSDHDARPWNGAGAVVKMSVLPGELDDMLSWLGETAGSENVDIVGRAGMAVLLIRLKVSPAAQIELINEMRARVTPGRGSVVLVRGDLELRRAVGVWGPIGDGLPVMRAVKRQFDPTGTLIPGGGPGGI